MARRLTALFQPLPLSGGVALVPREPLNGVRTLEVRGSKVSVNGASVTREVLRSWLEDSAPPVLELLDLPIRQQRSLFGFAPIAINLEEPELEEPVEKVLEATDVPPAPTAATAEAPAPAPERVPAPPVPPERPRRVVHSDARVSLGERVVIERDEITEDLVVIGNSLEIKGEVLGDALTIGGSVRVDGRVSGDVAAVGGTVYLEDDAQVHGGVTSIGGGIEREEGAEVFGELHQVTVRKGLFDSDDWFDDGPWSFGRPWPNPFRGVSRVFGGLGNFLFLVLMAGLVLLILPKQTGQVARVLEREPWKAGLIGLACLVLYWVVLVPLLAIACVILVITIIGIPVAALLILAFILATLVVVLLGYSSAALRLGSWFAGRFPGRFEGRFVHLLLGILLIEVWMFLASLLDFGGWVLFLPAILLLIFGWLVEFTASTMGIGAVVMSWYEERMVKSGGPTGSPLPPLPSLPSEAELEAELDAELEAAGESETGEDGSWNDEIFREEAPDEDSWPEDEEDVPPEEDPERQE